MTVVQIRGAILKHVKLKIMDPQHKKSNETYGIIVLDFPPPNLLFL